MSGKTEVIVVGAGASGMVAAIHAAREGVSVRILEHKEEAGKKLLMTGNGRCNLSNERMEPKLYRGTNPAFAENALSQFGVKETLTFFREIGVPVRSRDGYLYPRNGEARGVRDALLSECEKRRVSIDYEIGIKKIQKEADGFSFFTKQGTFFSEKCILATGGCTWKKTGSDGSGFLYLDEFHHPIKDIVPSLLQMKAAESFFKELAGIRAEAEITLFLDGEQIASDCGELQLTDYGISGIPVFQISRYAAMGLREQKKAEVRMNFFPMLEREELLLMFRELFSNSPVRASVLLSGSLPHKLTPVLLREADLEDLPGEAYSEEDLRKLLDTASALPATITGMYKGDQAQVSAGGVDTAYVFPETMESRLVKGLYFCGEMLDIDGPCGGYNLQWAWSSGAVAGHAAGKNPK